MTRSTRPGVADALEPPGRGAGSDLLIGLLAGVLAAWAAVAAGGLTTRWLVYFVAAAVLGAAVVLTTDRERFLSALFLLSLQVGAAYRIGYGKAGTDGIAIPVCFVTASLLILWWAVTGELTRKGGVRWFGSLGVPIVLMFTMSLLSFFFTTERFAGLAMIANDIELYAMFWIAINLVRSDEDLDRVVRLLLVSLATQSIVYYLESALARTFTPEGDIIPLSPTIPRPGGTVATNPAGFASYVIPLIIIALARYSIEKPGQRFRTAAVAAMGTIAVGLTFTRAAWGGLAMALTIFFAVGSRRRMVSRRSVAAVMGAILLAAALFGPGMYRRHVEEQSFDTAGQTRWGLILIAFRVIAAHPFVGVGAGAYGQVYKQYVPYWLPNQWMFTVHNEYVLRAAETGILGGAALILLIVLGLRQAWRLTAAPGFATRTTALGWGSGLFYLAWQMLWVPWRGFEYNALFWLFMGLMEAAALFPSVGRATRTATATTR
ncbi:MAG: O-antigen ligase family protein [Alphaproteobacteria bacterium]